MNRELHILGMAYNANGLYADTITLTENALRNDPNSQHACGEGLCVREIGAPR